MGWTNVSDKEKYEFNDTGDTLEGILLGCRKTRFDCNVYDIETVDDGLLYFFGCATLDSVLPRLIDKRISITYKGKVELDASRSLKEFDVNIWTEDKDTPEEKPKDEDIPL